MMKINTLTAIPVLLLVLFIYSTNLVGSESRDTITVKGSAGSVLSVESIAEFNEPWAMTFLSEDTILITEKPGNLLLYSLVDGSSTIVKGVPEVAYGGQGGLGDVILHPDYDTNRTIYISYAEADNRGRKGAVVARGRLLVDGSVAFLEELEKIWHQYPKVRGSGHYAHRLAFGPDKKLYITSGERQKQEPAQDWSQNLGKIIRLNEDGTIPEDNPFQNEGELAKTFWSIGHRNMLGMVFADDGTLWVHEMGPRHGDELNKIRPGGNYGWPEVSWGDQYSGAKIEDHDKRPEFDAPATYWVPTIAPSGLIFYTADVFSKWKGDLLLGGLASRSLIRIEIDGSKAAEVERFNMGKRIREVEQGPDGAIWLLQDRKGAYLLRLTPKG